MTFRREGKFTSSHFLPQKMFGVVFPLRGIPFFDRFSLLLQGSWGFGRDRKSIFFSLPICTTKNKERKQRVHSQRISAARKKVSPFVHAKPFAKRQRI